VPGPRLLLAAGGGRHARKQRCAWRQLVPGRRGGRRGRAGALGCGLGHVPLVIVAELEVEGVPGRGGGAPPGGACSGGAQGGRLQAAGPRLGPARSRGLGPGLDPRRVGHLPAPDPGPCSRSCACARTVCSPQGAAAAAAAAAGAGGAGRLRRHRRAALVAAEVAHPASGCGAAERVVEGAVLRWAPRAPAGRGVAGLLLDCS
jgi:hypothetical protein